MPKIVLPEAQLTRRVGAIQKLLRPISRVASGPSVRNPVASVSEFVLATFDGPSPANSDYREWRFKTNVDNVRGQYFERWARSGRSEVYLFQAYLHFFRLVGDDEKEVLCLHCDPSESDSAAHAKYKQGPHLHMTFVGPAYKHSHVALADGFVNEVLNSLDSLTAAQTRAIEMIRAQLLPYLAAA